MVYCFELTYDEIIAVLDLKHIPTKRLGYSLNPGIYEITDINKLLEHILPDGVKVTITKDDIRLKSKLKNNQTLIFTKKSSLINFLGFAQSHSYPLNDIDGFHQLIAGSYKSYQPVPINGIDKMQLRCDCVNGSIVNGIREPIFYSFALDKPLGRKVFKKLRIKLFNKIKKQTR